MDYKYRKGYGDCTEISLIDVFDYLKTHPTDSEFDLLDLNTQEVTGSRNPDIAAYCNMLYYFDAGENAQALDFMGVKVYSHETLHLPKDFDISTWNAVLDQINEWLEDADSEDKDPETLAGRYWNQLIQQGGDDTVYDYFNSHVSIFLDIVGVYLDNATLEE